MINSSIKVKTKDMQIFKDNNTDIPLECIERALSKLNGLYMIMEYKSKYNRIGVKEELKDLCRNIRCYKKEIKRFNNMEYSSTASEVFGGKLIYAIADKDSIQLYDLLNRNLLKKLKVEIPLDSNKNKCYIDNITFL